MGNHTIIGAKRFHFRGRDGIGWGPLAMAARQNHLCFSAEAWEQNVQLTTVTRSTQNAWVLYGQASRAISIR